MEVLYNFGLSSHRLKDFELNKLHVDRLNKLLILDDATEILNVSKHYVQHFIPTPIENEGKYWMCSCFPGDKYTPVRINIYWHEVFNVQKFSQANEGNPAWRILLFAHDEYLTSEIITELENTIPGLEFDRNFRYDTGLENQLAVKLPIKSYYNFVANENVFESIRQYNYQLSCKGRQVNKGHNHSLSNILLVT